MRVNDPTASCCTDHESDKGLPIATAQPLEDRSAARAVAGGELVQAASLCCFLCNVSSLRLPALLQNLDTTAADTTVDSCTDLR